MTTVFEFAPGRTATGRKRSRAVVSKGQPPEFESDHYAEWRIRDGDVIVLRYDRRTGAWTGERERPDPETKGQLAPQTLSPEEAQAVARAYDLRLRNGTEPT